MKALLITRDGVREVDYDGGLTQLYELLDCRTVEVIATRYGDVWVDEEGRFPEGAQPNWLLTDVVGNLGRSEFLFQPIFGFGLITGVPRNGVTTEIGTTATLLVRSVAEEAEASWTTA